MTEKWIDLNSLDSEVSPEHRRLLQENQTQSDDDMIFVRKLWESPFSRWLGNNSQQGEDNMRDENVETKRVTIRERIEKIHALLTEALVVEARICGEEPSGRESAESADYALDVIESELDRVLNKCEALLKQLHWIENRL